jgi:hypothetical protein
MTGLIWTIQLLHYPAFHEVEASRFGLFHASHSRKITYIVGPVMILELGSGVTLLFLHEVYWINLGFLLLIWLATAFVSVPAHNRLSEGKDAAVIDRLVRTNWYRTSLWTLRLLLLAASYQVVRQ